MLDGINKLGKGNLHPIRKTRNRRISEKPKEVGSFFLKKEKMETVFFDKSSKKKVVDAAVAREMIMAAPSKRGRVEFSSEDDFGRPVGKLKKKTEKLLNIFYFRNKLQVLFIEDDSFFVRNLTKGGLQKKERVVLVNSFGYDIAEKNLIGVNVFQVGEKLIMTYQRINEKGKLATFFAISPREWVFQEFSESKEINGCFVFASKAIIQGKYRGYFGENFIYFASSNSLRNWEAKKEHLLTPRQKFFDHNGLKIINTVEAREGILLLYESSFRKEGRFYLQIGGALFDRNQPDRLLWRSKDPIWEQSFLESEIKSIFSLGVASSESEIFLYYAINGAMMTADFYFPDFRKPEEKPVRLKKNGSNPILRPDTCNDWESKAAFNPTALYADDKFHLIYRAIGKDDVSSFGYAVSEDGINFKRFSEPAYVPREKFEGVRKGKYHPKKRKVIYDSGGGCSGGCEDPRLTKIDDRIYMTYVAFNGHDVPGVAMTSIDYADFINQRWNWERARLISKPREIQKNWVVFPKRIKEKHAVLHGLSPKIHIEYVDSLDELGLDNKYISSLPTAHGRGYPDPKQFNQWDNIVRGIGSSPLETEYGWLIFYHAMDRRDPNRYKIGAMILDKDDPEKIICRAKSPVLEPDERYENDGWKAGVVYTCGAVIEKENIHLYYGGADTVACVASAKLNDFLARLFTDKCALLERCF